MRWSQPADKRVVEAVLDAFTHSAAHTRLKLHELKLRQWERSYYWLDSSGMALYLLVRLEELNLAEALPPQVLERFHQNRADNSVRTAHMFAEFRALNLAFQQEGLSYCNQKGFTLVPDSCPRAELRCQLDFDFLIDGKQLPRFRAALESRGYHLRREIEEEQEFRTESNELPKIEGHYKPRPQHCVELHHTRDEHGTYSRDERLSNLASHTLYGFTFPALSPAEQFVAQALHLFKHLCNPGTRVSWILEFTHHARLHQNNATFWQQVQQHADSQPQGGMAVGASFRLAAKFFAAETPAALEAWVAARVPANVALWIDRYGLRAVLAGIPGTKLYLLLRDQLHAAESDWEQERRALLLPLHRAPRLVTLSPTATLSEKLRAEFYQFRFGIFRARFHIVQGIVYRIEASRWRRALRQRDASVRNETGQPRLTSI